MGLIYAISLLLFFIELFSDQHNQTGGHVNVVATRFDKPVKDYTVISDKWRSWPVDKHFNISTRAYSHYVDNLNLSKDYVDGRTFLVL